jgi:hypothetical protein
MVGEGIGTLLTDPAFMQVEKEAYWSEIYNGAYYRVPWLDKCSQASMVNGKINFHAPAGGLLFVQFLTPNCGECDRDPFHQKVRITFVKTWYSGRLFS